jgi:hypothetical protein
MTASVSKTLEKLEFKFEKQIGFKKPAGKVRKGFEEKSWPHCVSFLLPG